MPQALSIPTKIARGTIEIISDVPLIQVGDKVGMSEATLLNMLNISPFSYGLVVENVYDNGSIFSPKVLDITDDDLKATFMAGVANVAAVSTSFTFDYSKVLIPGLSLCCIFERSSWETSQAHLSKKNPPRIQATFITLIL